MAPIDVARDPGGELLRHLIHHSHRISVITEAADAMPTEQLLMELQRRLQRFLIATSVTAQLDHNPAGGELHQMASAGRHKAINRIAPNGDDGPVLGHGFAFFRPEPVVVHLHGPMHIIKQRVVGHHPKAQLQPGPLQAGAAILGNPHQTRIIAEESRGLSEAPACIACCTAAQSALVRTRKPGRGSEG